MKRLIAFAFGFLIFAQLSAQTLGEFKPKDTSYGLNKIKNGKASRIYIAGFDVNFQVYNEKEEYKQGGSTLGGGRKGDALTGLSVGLEGLDEKTVQDITDKLYQEYISKIKAKNLTIITPDEAAKTDSYNEFQRVQGGKISRAEVPGVLTSTPTGYEYFIKGLNKDGKEKKGGFLGNQQIMFAKLSKELDDAIIGNVDITVLFVQDQQAFQGAGAKLKVKTNLRVISTEGITTTNDAKIKFKGSNDVTVLSSLVEFYHGKVGAGATTVYSGTLSKPLDIDGVIEEEKLTSFAGNAYASAYPTIYGTFYSVTDKETKNAKIIPVDPVKYGEGVYKAASQFLTYHTDQFLAGL